MHKTQTDFEDRPLAEPELQPDPFIKEIVGYISNPFYTDDYANNNFFLCLKILEMVIDLKSSFIQYKDLVVRKNSSVESEL